MLKLTLIVVFWVVMSCRL